MEPDVGAPRATIFDGLARLRGACLLLGVLVGCGDRTIRVEHQSLVGTVESIRPDTGQLTLRVRELRGEPGEDRRLSCLLTSGSEIYVNDRFVAANTIVAGDVIEVFGYPDPNPRADRFVVALAHISRREPRPAEPVLRPTTSPPTRPAGETHGRRSPD